MGDKDYSATPLSQKLGAKPGVDVLVFFTTSRKELERRFAKLRRTMAPADGLWVAWPKKASKMPTDLTEDRVRDIALPEGYVDVKVCAIDETWSGLKLVKRLENRRKPI